jgi:hypothetical protein
MKVISGQQLSAKKLLTFLPALRFTESGANRLTTGATTTTEPAKKMMAVERRCFTTDASRITILILCLFWPPCSARFFVLYIQPIAWPGLWRWTTSAIGQSKGVRHAFGPR